MNMGIRQFHRWVALAFIGGVIANIVAIARLQGTGQAQPAFWVYLLALVPLALLLLTGLYLFVLPYVARCSGKPSFGRE